MKKVFVAMILAIAVAASAHAATISLAPTALTVTPVGTIFTIDVVVSGVGAPGAEVLDVAVLFNPARINAISASEGEFMAQQNPDIPLAFGSLFDNTNGVLSYTIARLGANVFMGSGTAVMLTFECMGAGLDIMTYVANLGDQAGGTLVSGQGTVAVQQGAIPEPMTMVLVGAALTALGVVARKRS
jgi:hypothetical protein